MADKAERMKARLPRGFVDRHAGDIRAVKKMTDEIGRVFELYGFEPVEQPMVEYTDALGKFLPDQDRPNEGVFSFQDDDEQWLSLRYDLTAPLARFVAENFEQLPKPYRSYRSGWVFRNEKPGPGRFRQFMQFDADIVGMPGVAADAEMAMMMADTLEAVGIKRGDYVIRVNNRKVLDGVLEAIGLGGDENAGRRLTVLRAIDKLDKFGPEGVRQLLGKGRLDESGDFTKGAGLDEEQIYCLEPLLSYSRNADKISVAIEGDEPGDPIFENVERAGRELVEPVKPSVRERLNRYGWDNASALGYMAAMFDRAKKIFPGSGYVAWMTTGFDAYAELSKVASIIHSSGYDNEIPRVVLDLSVVRGLEYYTGPVYEAELTFPVVNEQGETVRFGSVAGGGRYDGLVSRFRGEPVPATGFSIGVSRLTAALKNLGKLETNDVVAPVVVLVMDKDTESLGRYQRMVSSLRQAGIRAEMYLGGAGMKAQMKYADRRGSPCVVIQGGDERSRGEVQIKDLVEGARLSAEITDNEAWREGRPAQFSVPEAELVEAVRKVLDAQAAGRNEA